MLSLDSQGVIRVVECSFMVSTLQEIEYYHLFDDLHDVSHCCQSGQETLRVLELPFRGITQISRGMEHVVQPTSVRICSNQEYPGFPCVCGVHGHLYMEGWAVV